MSVRRALGGLLKALGGLLQFGGIIGILVARDAGWEALVVLVLVTGVGAMLLHIGKSLKQLTGEELLEQDKRSPVLLLRSFGRDNISHTVYNKIRARDYFGLEPGIKAIGRVLKGNIGFEELLEEQFKPLGPFIAIGRPGEKLQAVGASRLYETDDTWKERVSELVDKSSAIIIVLDQTPGLMWELSHLTDVQIRKKVLLLSVATPAQAKRQEIFSEWESLIAENAGIHVHLDETVVGIYFDQCGQPVVLHSEEHDIADRIKTTADFVDYRMKEHG